MTTCLTNLLCVPNAVLVILVALVVALIVGLNVRLLRRGERPNWQRYSVLTASAFLIGALVSVLWWSAPGVISEVAQLDQSAPVGQSEVVTEEVVSEAPSEPVAASQPVVVIEQEYSSWDDLIGVHPMDVAKNADFARLLKASVGEDVEKIISGLTVAPVSEKTGSFLVASGMEAHSGGAVESAFALDTLNNKLYVVWHREKEVRLYGVNAPEELPAWLRQWYLDGQKNGWNALPAPSDKISE